MTELHPEGASRSSVPASHRAREVAIVGTRGIPARYGGFETLAEQLAINIDSEHTLLTIYGQRSAYSSDERSKAFNGHKRIWIPFSASGGQSLIHDALQLAHAAFIGNHRSILILGTSAAWLLPFVMLFRPRLRVVTNIDGLEWRRDKFGPLARRLLKFLEKLAVRHSSSVIADNDALVGMVRTIHGVEPAMIAYGADQVRLIEGRGSDPEGHLLAIARVEPENNTAMILEAVQKADKHIVFMGNWADSTYGRQLLSRFSSIDGCDLRAPNYSQDDLASIRSGSSVYIHGHSVGGTNPSLVEAIFHSERILAFDCPFNRATLANEGAYFTDADHLAVLLQDKTSGVIDPRKREMLKKRYRWKSITTQYLALLFDD